MKKIALFIFSLFILTYTANSQYIDQALKFSTYDVTGSARFLSMGGAFGALGGDLSAVTINPAGIGVFRSSELMITPGLTFDNTSSLFLNNTTKDNIYKVGLSNFGFVASYDLGNTDSRWVNSNFAITYNRVSDLNSSVMMSGENIFSLIEEYVYRANDLNIWDDYYEELFWQTYLFNEDTSGLIISEITDTINANPSGFNINQQKTIKNEGSIGEFNFTFGANYAHKLYVGASIGIYKINHKQFSSHYEYEGANTLDVDNFEYFILDEVVKTTGTGFSFKAGVIYKPVEFIRLGFSFHLPIFYNIEETYYNTVEGYTADTLGVLTAESETGKYEYTLVTPYRLNASLGFQIEKFALIDIDYEFVDYSSMKLGDEENNQGRIDDNKYIDQLFQGTHTIRGGAEVRFGPMYLRGGASYRTCQWEDVDGSFNSETDSYSISGGVGYRQNNFYLDFGMRQFRQKYYYGVLSGNPDLDIATIDQVKNNFALTVGFKF